MGHIVSLREEWNRARARSAKVPMWAKPRYVRRMEAGRRLASEREDLIAQGINPAELLIPLAPDEENEG